jgi:hypothetical protein
MNKTILPSTAQRTWQGVIFRKGLLYKSEALREKQWAIITQSIVAQLDILSGRWMATRGSCGERSWHRWAVAFQQPLRDWEQMVSGWQCHSNIWVQVWLPEYHFRNRASCPWLAECSGMRSWWLGIVSVVSKLWNWVTLEVWKTGLMTVQKFLGHLATVFGWKMPCEVVLEMESLTWIQEVSRCEWSSEAYCGW